MHEYLGLEGGPPIFRQGFTCPALLKSLFLIFAYGAVTRYGRPFQVRFANKISHQTIKADPRSLAATNGISYDFFSSAY
jgi:hypothetical protein